MSKLTEMLEKLDLELESEVEKGVAQAQILELKSLRQVYTNEVEKLQHIKRSLELKQETINKTLAVVNARIQINRGAMKLLGEH